MEAANKEKKYDEIIDIENRLNDLELQMVDAKEFTFISSDAFDALQKQITELREMLEQLLVIKNNSTVEEKTTFFSEYL